ncbi:MAG: DMT family transporter [Pseudomonadota bacterium]
MTAPSPDAPGSRNWFLITVLGVIWGSAFMATTVALEGFGSLQVAAGRVLVAAIILSCLRPILRSQNGRIEGARAWAFALIIGTVSTALPFLLLSVGLQYVPSAFAGIAMGAVPLLVLPLAALFLPDENIGPRRIAGLSMGFVGLVFLMSPSLTSGGSETELIGQLACIGAAFCYATGSIVTRRAPKMPPFAFASTTLWTASVVLVPAALVIEGLPATWDMRAGLALIYVAALPTAAAAVIRILVITTAGSLFMSLTSYMVPVWAVIFGVALLGEQITLNVLVALAVILGGIALAQWSAGVQRRRSKG